MNVTPLVWWLFALALLLDVYFVWAWRRYRRMKQATMYNGHLSRWELVRMAMMPGAMEESGGLSEQLSADENLGVELGDVNQVEGIAQPIEMDSMAFDDDEDSTSSDNDEENRAVAWFKTLMLVVGFGLVSISLWIQKEGWEGGWDWGKWALLVAGLLAFIFGQRIKEEQGLPPWTKRFWNASSRWLDVKFSQILLLALSPILAVFASMAAGGGKLMNNVLIAVLAWLASICFAMMGGWRSAARKKVPPITIYIVALLVFGAFIIRFVDVSNMPIVLSGDEASAGLNAIEFIDGELNNIYRVGWNSFPTFYFYIQSIPISILGQTTLALRILSVVAGALTVGALYLLVREMFDGLTALLAAIFLATLHYHNHFSRIGLNNVWDGFWFVIVLGLLWYGWEKERRGAFLFAGLFLGLSQYFYVSGRTLYLFIPAWFVLVGIFDWPKFKRNLSHLFLLELVALVTFFPLARFFIENPQEFMAPMRRVSLLGPWLESEVQITGTAPWRILLEHIGKSFMGFTHIPLQFWYRPFEPILRFLPATLFFLGLSSLLIKLRQTRMLLLGIWLLTLGVMGGLSESTPAAQRYVAVAPVLAILVAYGLGVIVEELSKVWKSQRKLFSVLAVLAVLALGADEIRFYVNDYTPVSDFGGVNTRVAQRLADHLQDKSDKYQVFFFGLPRMGYRSISSTVYLAPHIEGFDVREPWGSKENPQPTSDHLIFVFLPEHETKLETVREEYPSGSLSEEIFREDELLYFLYEVSPDL